MSAVFGGPAWRMPNSGGSLPPQCLCSAMRGSSANVFPYSSMLRPVQTTSV